MFSFASFASATWICLLIPPRSCVWTCRRMRCSSGHYRHGKRCSMRCVSFYWTPPSPEKWTYSSHSPCYQHVKSSEWIIDGTVKGFIRFDFQLGDINRSIEALLISWLRPDDILLDNSVTSLFGAKLDRKNQCLTFHSSNVTISAVHRVGSRYRAQTISSSSLASVSVASVHADFEVVPVSLKTRFIYQPVQKHRLLLAPEIHLFSTRM